MDKKRDLGSKVHPLGAKTDAIKALEARANFHEKVVGDIEATKAKLFAPLPSFQVDMGRKTAIEPGVFKAEKPVAAVTAKISLDRLGMESAAFAGRKRKP